MQPDIRYARNGDVAIAYQVVGEGERDLVWVPDYVSNLVYAWESPYWREFYERLTRSFRLILFDKRGTGLSDRGGAGWVGGARDPLVSQTVRDLVAGSGLAFDDRGVAELKGVPGDWRLYAVAAPA